MKKDNWKSAFSYVTGKSHIKKSLPCQDRAFSFQKRHSSGAFHGVALADGAGSCLYSHIGAKFITENILKFISSKFSYLFSKVKNPQKAILSHIEKELKNLAKTKKIPLKELSSTLLFVGVKNQKIIAGHIGDGVIGILKRDGTLQILSFPENGEFSNSTYFTTTESYPNRLRIYKMDAEKISGFILLSDGSAESLYDKQNKVLAPANKTIINWLQKASEEEVAKALNDNLQKIISQKTIDDCSIAIMRKLNNFDN